MEVTNFAAQALGYNSLKEHQIEVVLAVAGGRDVHDDENRRENALRPFIACNFTPIYILHL